jgi:hypothetical protein
MPCTWDDQAKYDGKPVDCKPHLRGVKEGGFYPLSYWVDSATHHTSEDGCQKRRG